jgi:hypothetical protein
MSLADYDVRAIPERAITCVYAIQAGADGPIKLGVARRPEQRLRDLQTANASELRLVATWPAPRWEEADLHEMFAHARIRGEWFRPEPDLLEYVLREADKK